LPPKAGVVRISGRGSNVDFTIDDSAPFEQVAAELREYLVANRGLWSSGTVGVNAGRWTRSPDQLSRLRDIIESGSGLTVGRFWCSPGKLNEPDPSVAASDDTGGDRGRRGDWTLGRLTDGVNTGRTRSRGARSAAANSRKGLPSQALFVKTTFRSGESIRHPGDVVVLADVNPGAEISAEGDIVVFGSLRGFAHAGSSGDTKATIIALELDAPRLQIGPYTGLAPATSRASAPLQAGPTIAYLRKRTICVAPYAGRFARYSRGIPYDG
jgi:hypothetical protein